MIKSIKVDKILNAITLLAVVLLYYLFFYRFVRGKLITNVLSEQYNGIAIGVLCVLFIIIVIKSILRVYDVREIVIFAVVFSISLGIVVRDAWLNSLDLREMSFDIVAYCLCVMACKSIDYRVIIKVTLITFIVLDCSMLLFSNYGELDNVLQVGQFGRLRYTLGKNTPAENALKSLYVIMMYVYIRNVNIKKFEILILFLYTLLIYFFTNTRLQFLLSVLFLFITFKLIYYDKLNINISELRLYVFIIVVSILILVSYYFVTMHFDKDNQLLQKVNNLLTGRLELTNASIDERKIAFFGTYTTYTMNPLNPSIVDSSFFKLLLDYGVILYIFFIMLNFYFLHLIITNHDWILLIIYLVSFIDLVFSTTLFYMQYNMLFFVLSYKLHTKRPARFT